jgi:hypothetical protein
MRDDGSGSSWVPWQPELKGAGHRDRSLGAVICSVFFFFQECVSQGQKVAEVSRDLGVGHVHEGATRGLGPRVHCGGLR